MLAIFTFDLLSNVFLSGSVQVKSPEQRMSAPFQQVQVIRQVSPAVRQQITPPRTQPQPTSTQIMRSPIIVQRFHSPPGANAPNPPSSAPAPPVILQQQRPQTSMPMFLANSSVISGQQIQRISLGQNLSNSPASIVVSIALYVQLIFLRFGIIM